ncbi:hypothetical protein FQR65_LT06773 [Abscondita terminalis]|nr:hypothetical protein FQR65_LT06773 [Abscondita terminalis]
MEVKSARENPELFRIFLKEIVKNVAATASSEKSETEKDYRFIELFIQDRFKQTVNNFIDVMWESFDIESKSKHLYELQKQFPPDYVAW